MRYVNLWLQFFKMSAMADLEYRLNVSIRFFGELIWYVTQLSVFEVLYLHTNTLYGWDVNAMRVFMGSLFLVDAFYTVFFHENFENVFSLIRKGDLDLYLTKPVNSQFMVTFRKVGVTYMLNGVVTSAYLVWAILRLPGEIAWSQWALYGVFILCGLAILYCSRFLFSILTVVLQDAGNIHFVWYQLYRLGTRPDILYPRTLRFLVLTILPVGFFASVPARILVEGVPWNWLAWGLIVSIGLIVLTSWLWERALRGYTSASS